jgi:hypothetical protein
MVSQNIATYLNEVAYAGIFDDMNEDEIEIVVETQAKAVRRKAIARRGSAERNMAGESCWLQVLTN